MTDLETQLREQIRAIYERAQAEAGPLIAKLVELENLKPPQSLMRVGRLNDLTGTLASIAAFEYLAKGTDNANN